LQQVVRQANNSKIRLLLLGAGSAGCGIAEQIIAQMVAEGLRMLKHVLEYLWWIVLV
jgi:malic enzyme